MPDLTRTLPAEPIPRLQARLSAARVHATACDKAWRDLDKTADDARDTAACAWATFQAYEYLVRLPIAVGMDEDLPLDLAVQARVERLLADVEWDVQGRWLDHKATATVAVDGVRLHYDSRTLQVRAGCPKAAGGADHVAVVNSHVQLAWAITHLDQLDDPRWICEQGHCNTDAAATTAPAASSASAPDA